MVYLDCEDIVIACDPVSEEDERPGPETTQLFTSDALQDMVDEFPERRRAGLALIETRGDDTVTVAVAGREVPPGPVHVIE